MTYLKRTFYIAAAFTFVYSPFTTMIADSHQADIHLNQSQNLKKNVDDYWEFLMLQSPEWASFVSYPGLNQYWTDYSTEALQKQKIGFSKFERLLENIQRDKLTAEEKIDYDILSWDLKVRCQSMDYPGECLLLNQLDGFHIMCGHCLLIMPKRTVEDYLNIIERLQGIPKVLSQIRSHLNEGLETGITPPGIVLRDIPDQIQSLIECDPKDSVFFLPFASFPETFLPEEKLKLSQLSEEVISEEVIPAFAEFKKYVEQDYIPNCRKSIAFSELPQGKDWYALKVKENTTTNLSPQEIHTIGIAEVARIKNAMLQILDEVHFEGTLKEFNEYINTDPCFFYTDRESLLEGYRSVLKSIEEKLPSLFGKLPHSPYEIKEMRPHEAKSAPAAYYFPGSLSDERPGRFYVNTYDLKARPKWEMEALALHEALPGHHLQVSLAQELESLSEFRKHAYYNAFVEGWGLYAESLGDQLGLYQDPYSRYGRLTYEMMRAIRLVVDTGMHALGWSRQDAIDYFKDNTGIHEMEVVNEVDRYLTWPGQALAYKIGEMKIKQWRQFAKETLGDRFDIRDFHDFLLKHGGCVPLDVFEKQVMEWVEEKQQ